VVWDPLTVDDTKNYRLCKINNRRHISGLYSSSKVYNRWFGIHLEQMTQKSVGFAK